MLRSSGINGQQDLVPAGCKERGPQWLPGARRIETAIEASYFAPRFGLTKEEAVSIITHASTPMNTKRTNASPNNFETGACVPKPGKSLRPDPIHTGDPADEPKKPYGLVEDREDVNDKTRHSDGRSRSHRSLRGYPG